MHRNTDYQTTSLVKLFKQPLFTNQRMQTLIDSQPNLANKTFPQFTPPYYNNDIHTAQHAELFYMLQEEQVYPEYMWIHMQEYDRLGQTEGDLTHQRFVEILMTWYDEVDTFMAQNKAKHGGHHRRSFSKQLLKIKPEYRDKIIKRGYMANPENHGKMGMIYDLARKNQRYD